MSPIIINDQSWWVVAVYSVVPQALVAVRAVAVRRVTSAVVTIVSVQEGTFVVKDKLVAHRGLHVVSLLLDVVPRRTVSVAMEVVVPRMTRAVVVEDVAAPTYLFVAPMVSPAEQRLQTARVSERGSIRWQNTISTTS